MPSQEETRARLVEGASKVQLLEEGHSASSISKCQTQLKKAGESFADRSANGHIPFANLDARGFPHLNPSAEKTQELSEEVRQAKLNQELSALQGGSELQGVRAELAEMRQAMRDQQHREELGRLEAKITAMEGRAVTQAGPSALETLLQPMLSKILERGMDPPDAGLKLDLLGDGKGIGVEVLDKLDDLVGRRQEREIRSQFFQKAYEYLPDVIEAAKRMAAGVEAHAAERGVTLGSQNVQVHNCPSCGVGLGAEPTDELIRCPACGVTFEAATLRIVEEGPAFGGEESGPEPLGGRSPIFAKDGKHGE